MQRIPILVLLAGLPAAAAITHVRVDDEERTPTQAVLRYTAPNEAACTVEVSESSGFTPLVHDVDPVLFAGSNGDDRPSSVRSGVERVFVIGKRTAELASDGRYYSRALQQSTVHYYRITCGADVATGSFTTTAPAWGLTYNEPFPVDPDRPGEYAYPTIDLSEPTTPATPGVTFSSSGDTVTFSGSAPTTDLAVGDMLVIDSGPQRGQYRRVAARPNSTHATLASGGGFTPFTSDQPAGTAWRRRTPERTNDQRIIDPTTGFLVRRITGPGMWPRTGDYASPGAPHIDGVNAGAGWTNGSLAALASTDGNSASFTGGACAPDCPWLVLHPASSQGVSTSYNDDNKQLAAVIVQVRGSAATGGEDGKIEVCLSADGATCRSAIHEVDLSNCEGSTCYLGDERPVLKYWNRTDNVVASYIDRVEFFGPAGAILVRKKTNTGTVDIDYIGGSYVLSDGHSWLSQSYQVCSDHYDTQTYGGTTRTGYRCLFAANSPVFFIDRETGDSVPTTSHWINGGSDSGGTWAASWLGQSTGGTWDPTDPKVMYAGPANKRSGGGLIVLKSVYTGANLDMGPFNPSSPPGSYLQTVSSFSRGDSVESKLETFLTGHSPSFQASRWLGNCSIAQVVDDAYIGGWCLQNGQDTGYGWDFLIGLAGAGAGEMAAAHSTHSHYPYRFNTLHSGPRRQVTGGWLYMGSNDLASSTACTGGPFRTELAEAMDAPGGAQDVACPDPLPTNKTGAACTKVTVTGDLYKPATTCPWENTNRGDPPSGFLDLQAARVGDVFKIDSERVQVVAKAGACSDPNAACDWTFLRGIDKSATAAHAAGVFVTASRPNSAQFFHYAADPYGEGSYPEQVAWAFPGHCGPFLNGRMGCVTDTSMCHLADYPCYSIFAGTVPEISGQNAASAPTAALAATQRFGDVIGQPYYADSHLSYQQREPGETDWMVDAFPEANPLAAVQTWNYVGTSSTLYTTTLAASKARPVEGNCIHRPLKDVTPGPIVDGSAGAYTFCLGECGQGGGQTSAYVNCPDARPAATKTCESTLSNDASQICLYNTSSMAHGYRQVRIDRNDPFGDRQRNLGGFFERHRLTDPFLSGAPTFDGRWLFVRPRWVDGVRSDVYAVKIGPQPPDDDSVRRRTFLPLAIQTGSAPAGTATATAEFGYDPQLHCGTRNEACVAAATGPVNEATPFYWASETYSGVACASGCSLTLPVISQRVVYYRWRYRAADGSPVPSGALQVTVSR